MSGNTTNEGYPFPFTSDFADVQDAYRLAAAVDASLRAETAPFRNFLGAPSFIARQTSNGSGFISGTQSFNVGAVDWDNTGGIVVGNQVWTQPLSQAPSWWMFGETIQVATISGTPAVGDLVMGQLAVNTTDQVSGVVTTTTAYQRDDESNAGGQWLNLFTMAAVYRATVRPTLRLSGSTQKAIGAGSTFWGLCLGPVT